MSRSVNRHATHRQPIGVFDSGVGGLSVLDELVYCLPNESFVYLGDSANVPYGSKDEATLRQILLTNTRWLAEAQQVKMLVFACNTSDAVLMRHLTNGGSPEELLPDVVYVRIAAPAAKMILNTKPMHIGVLATPMTVLTGLYPHAIHEILPQCQVSQVAATNLARQVELNQTHSPGFEAELKDLLAQFPDNIQALVLGCTHYPFVASVISHLYPQWRLIDPARAVAQETAEQLKKLDLESDGKVPPQIRFFVSGDPQSFMRTAATLPLRHVRVDNVQSSAIAIR